MSEPDPSAWIASIAEILDDVGVDWAIVGALAANRYRSTPRFTTDLDAMATFDPELVHRFKGAGYDVTVVSDPGELPHMLRCRRGSEAVDILIPIIEYQRVALARSQDHVLTAEDVVIHKLIAGRRRDLDDVRSIIEAGADLDLAYIDEWVDVWELGERWDQFRP